MARSKEVTVVLGRTVNLGDYNSARVEMGETLVLERGDVPRRVRALALKQLKREVGAVVEELDAPPPPEPSWKRGKKGRRHG